MKTHSAKYYGLFFGLTLFALSPFARGDEPKACDNSPKPAANSSSVESTLAEDLKPDPIDYTQYDALIGSKLNEIKNSDLELKKLSVHVPDYKQASALFKAKAAAKVKKFVDSLSEIQKDTNDTLKPFYSKLAALKKALADDPSGVIQQSYNDELSRLTSAVDALQKRNEAKYQAAITQMFITSAIGYIGNPIEIEWLNRWGEVLSKDKGTFTTDTRRDRNRIRDLILDQPLTNTPSDSDMKCRTAACLRLLTKDIVAWNEFAGSLVEDLDLDRLLKDKDFWIKSSKKIKNHPAVSSALMEFGRDLLKNPMTPKNQENTIPEIGLNTLRKMAELPIGFGAALLSAPAQAFDKAVQGIQAFEKLLDNRKVRLSLKLEAPDLDAEDINDAVLEIHEKHAKTLPAAEFKDEEGNPFSMKVKTRVGQQDKNRCDAIQSDIAENTRAPAVSKKTAPTGGTAGDANRL